MTKLIVDFLMPEAGGGRVSKTEVNVVPDAVVARPTAGVLLLRKCSCGSKDYVLASEMTADSIKGVPSSRMYECINCGTYRLG